MFAVYGSQGQLDFFLCLMHTGGRKCAPGPDVCAHTYLPTVVWTCLCLSLCVCVDLSKQLSAS